MRLPYLQIQSDTKDADANMFDSLVAQHLGKTKAKNVRVHPCILILLLWCAQELFFFCQRT